MATFRQHRVRHRTVNPRALIYAVDGPEKAYPVYRFGNGKVKRERPRQPGTTYPGIE